MRSLILAILGALMAGPVPHVAADWEIQDVEEILEELPNPGDVAPDPGEVLPDPGDIIGDPLQRCDGWAVLDHVVEFTDPIIEGFAGYTTGNDLGDKGYFVLLTQYGESTYHYAMSGYTGGYCNVGNAGPLLRPIDDILQCAGAAFQAPDPSAYLIECATTGPV